MGGFLYVSFLKAPNVGLFERRLIMKEENDELLKQSGDLATTNFEAIYSDVSTIIKEARETAYKAVDIALLKRNWLLGKRIVEEELKDTRIENYGLEIIKKLSKRLSFEFGKGFEQRNLYRFVQFYKMYPNILPSLMTQSFLSWTHYVILMQVISDKARKWYEEEAIKGSWSVRALQRNVNTNMFDRMLITHSSEAIRNEVERNANKYADRKLEFVKNPLILEFLEIPENNEYNENKIEKSIINHIQKFLLEMGKGYCFVGRQVRIHADPDNYYVDLGV